MPRLDTSSRDLLPDHADFLCRVIVIDPSAGASVRKTFQSRCPFPHRCYCGCVGNGDKISEPLLEVDLISGRASQSNPTIPPCHPRHGAFVLTFSFPTRVG